MSVELIHGDCLEVLTRDELGYDYRLGYAPPMIPNNSVDSVTTDPPYGLEFMGKEWDGADGFRRSLNPADVGRDNPFGRTSRTSPEYRTNTTRRRHLAACFSCECGGEGEPGIGHPVTDDCHYNRECPPNCPMRPASPKLHTFQQWCEVWATECLRVLKPGGHLLAFGGTRTWHRLACAVEDAGFEVRDSIAYLYGSGFPKSLNATKALDAARCRCEMGEWPHGTGEAAGEHGLSDVPNTDVSKAEGTPRGAGAVLLPSLSEQGSPVAGRSELPATAPRADEPSLEGRGDTQASEGELPRSALRPLAGGVLGDGAGGWLHHGAPAGDGAVDRSLPTAVGGCEPQGPQPGEQLAVESGAVPVKRGSQAWGGWPVCERCSQPVVPDGLGTALKPGHEPIVVARKPLVGTVAANVLAHGTGALNVDGCRVATDERMSYSSSNVTGATPFGTGTTEQNPAGRWPANVVLDSYSAAALDEQSGTRRNGGQNAEGPTGAEIGAVGITTRVPTTYAGDTGGASRFFYTSKADSGERVKVDGIAHPTVKPLSLMRWLVRLVTPPGGTVLEPFAGSGTTVEACILEGFSCIAIEREADYLPLIQQRINRRRDPVAAIKATGDDGGLFDLLDGGAA